MQNIYLTTSNASHHAVKNQHPLKQQQQLISPPTLTKISFQVKPLDFIPVPLSHRQLH